MTQVQFLNMSLGEQVQHIYKNGAFITDIRYYEYKVNLFLLEGNYFEVFINHKSVEITKISPLNYKSNRLFFYLDQVKLPKPQE